MRLPSLARRREFWVPTLWGWLAILGALALGIGSVVHGLHPFLAPSQPVGARTLVVEGWMPPEELEQAVDAFRAGGYERVVTTGGPVPSGYERLGHASYAELAKEILEARGLRAGSVSAVPTPASAQDRTFLSAVMVREWAQEKGIGVDALDVFSTGAHARRSWMLYRLAFGPDVRVGILCARPSTYEPDSWWTSSAGARAVLSEAIGWAWTAIFFHPGPPGSHEERWARPLEAAEPGRR